MGQRIICFTIKLKKSLQNKSNRVLKQELVRAQYDFNTKYEAEINQREQVTKNFKQFRTDIKRLGISENSKNSLIRKRGLLRKWPQTTQRILL